MVTWLKYQMLFSTIPIKYFAVLYLKVINLISRIFFFQCQHLQVLEALLQDFLLGDQLLLVGNQGVGMNRLIDRLLALMNRPRIH